MLINGLKYIRPCQQSLYSRRSIDEILKDQYKNIRTIVEQCLDDNRMSKSNARAQHAFAELEHMMTGLKLKKIPRKLQRRARHECKVVRSIQRLLRQRTDIMICRVDKTKALYLGNATVMKKKAQEYMIKTKAYQEISTGRSPLADNLHGLQTLLDYVFKTKGLTEKQCKQLCPKLDRLELAHYHGVPKVHKEGTPLRPIIASINAPTTLLSKFLNNLLAPIYLEAVQEITFINSIDVIRKLEKYKANGYLKATTKFITSDVKDLYTMIPRDGAIEALIRFLEKHSDHGKIGTLTINQILKMARFILDNNYFVYDNKYYRQTRGGAMGSAFTQVLANIYMLEWEQDLIQYQKSHNEIYGRYLDDILMTTKETLAEINIQLEKAKKKDINIEIESTISTSVNFLDVTITNDSGQLRTSIYHKPTAEPYILPYTSDHPRHIHRNIPYAALLRAARICSHVDDFNSERIRIDMPLLLNQYPPNFITKHFNRFFQMNNSMSVINNLDEHAYQQLHRKSLHQPTRREKQCIQMIQNPVKSPEVLKTRIWDCKVMHPSYLFDTGLTVNFQQEFYQWWKKHYTYPSSSVKNVKIRFIPKTNRTLEQLFIHKKPPRELLTRME